MSHEKIRILLNDPYGETESNLKKVIDTLIEASQFLSVLEYSNSMPDLTKAKSKLRKARYALLEFEKIIGTTVNAEVIADYAQRPRQRRGNPDKLIPGGGRNK